MKRVLLVDDEMIVRKGLRKLVEWEKFGMEVIADAPDGQAAWDILRQDEIDLVITDIRMPICDGIELLRKIKEYCPQTKVILLTCYSDFEYVQEALEIGASGYLLKTDMEDGKLEHVLGKLKREWERSEASQNVFEQMKLKVEQTLPLLYEKKMKQLLEQKYFPAKAGEQDGMLELDWFDSLQLLMVIELPSETGIALPRLENIFAKLLPREKWILFPLEEAFFVSARLPEQKSEQEGLEQQHKLLQSVWDMLKRDCFPQLNLYYGKSYNQASLLQKLPHLLKTREYCTFYHGFGAKVAVDMITLPEAPDGELIDLSQFKQLAILHQWNGIREQCRQLLHACREQKVPVRAVKSLFSEMVSIIMDSKQTSSLTLLHWGANQFDYVENIKEKRTLEELLQWFLTGIDQLEQRQTIYFSGVSKMIQDAVHFIEKNYFKEITLDDLSEHVGLSKSYVSSTFKKSVGLSFVDYLVRIRIEKAKELIAQTDLKIWEVAERVGFNDPKYFTKMFKRSMGISPRRFKNKLRHSS
ncbi:response regulator [Brevibacillus sp. B_LB10_24]